MVAARLHRLWLPARPRRFLQHALLARLAVVVLRRGHRHFAGASARRPRLLELLRLLGRVAAPARQAGLLPRGHLRRLARECPAHRPAALLPLPAKPARGARHEEARARAAKRPQVRRRAAGRPLRRAPPRRLFGAAASHVGLQPVGAVCLARRLPRRDALRLPMGRRDGLAAGGDVAARVLPLRRGPAEGREDGLPLAPRLLRRHRRRPRPPLRLDGHPRAGADHRRARGADPALPPPPPRSRPAPGVARLAARDAAARDARVRVPRLGAADPRHRARAGAALLLGGAAAGGGASLQHRGLPAHRQRADAFRPQGAGGAAGAGAEEPRAAATRVGLVPAAPRRTRDAVCRHEGVRGGLSGQPVAVALRTNV
mmetsp:Transcript_29187/g.93335  ORF Transcript_29187/g.93335 Transcript_29187/m.93335 type:complete len:372 (+) Transcript_29187:1452-2567(+)